MLGLVRLLAVSPFSVPTGSMRPTLRPGDHVLVDRVGFHLHHVHRGDLVVVDGTDVLVPGPARRYVVKRVLGVGGDRVVCCDPRGRLVVNGRSLDEPYLFDGDAPSDVRFDVTVPDGRLWLLGDHRARSVDSRSLLGSPGGGMVRADRVVGRAFAIFWPPSRWGGLD